MENKDFEDEFMDPSELGDDLGSLSGFEGEEIEQGHDSEEPSPHIASATCPYCRHRILIRLDPADKRLS